MKEDLRTIKTRKAIEEATIQLIEVNGFDKVKICDIAKSANVNRNTIYLHYSSKEDIVEQIINNTFAEQWKLIDIASFTTKRNSARMVKQTFTTALKALSNKIEFYRIILTDPNLAGYVERIIYQIRQIANFGIKPTKRNQLIIEYMIRGAYGIIQYWIIYASGTIDEISTILSHLIYKSYRQMDL